VAKSLASGSQTLDQAAAALELEAKIWGQYLHHAILEEAALEGLPPEQFDKRASESADEIALMAANEFAVQCGRDTTNGVTPILIGHISAVINSDEPPEINTWGSIVQCLKKVLADYPQEYRRQNLSVYKLTRGAESVADESSGPPAWMTTNSPQGIAGSEAKTTAVTPTAPTGAPSPQQEPVEGPESPKVTPDRDERSTTYLSYVRACKERSVKMTEARLANLANRNWSTRDPVAKWKQLKDRSGDDALIRAAIRKGPPKA
jgi:hypothetical protein